MPSADPNTIRISSDHPGSGPCIGGSWILQRRTRRELGSCWTELALRLVAALRVLTSYPQTNRQWRDRWRNRLRRHYKVLSRFAMLERRGPGRPKDYRIGADIRCSRSHLTKETWALACLGRSLLSGLGWWMSCGAGWTSLRCRSRNRRTSRSGCRP